MADGRRRGLWARLRAFYWGEAALWFCFLFLAFVAGTAHGEDKEAAVTLAGIFALAAIGVRATRATPERDDVQP